MSEGSHPELRQPPPILRERQGDAVGEASTDGSLGAGLWERPLVGFALSATIPGLVLSVLGPFGTFGAPLWMRFAYWMPTMALGAVLGALLSFGIERVAALRSRPVARVVVGTLAITAAMSGIAWGMGRLVFGPDAITFGPEFVFYVFLISAVAGSITAVVRARAVRIAIASAPVPATAGTEPVPLIARLPVRLQDGAILALQGEDHYVRVHTDKGSDLLLIRLADAIELMGACPGARAHRSWWVAKAAVAGVRRENGRVWLKLTPSLEAPVSRNYASELRKAGWLD